MSAGIQSFFPRVGSSSASQNKAVRVLLVDDDPAYVLLCQRFLARDPYIECELVAVTTGADGLKECESHSFDCLIVDSSLPDISGREMIAALKKKIGDAMPPSIIMTAMVGESAAAEVVRAGATDFLPKGVLSAQSLSRSIQNAIEKHELKHAVEQRSRELRQANLLLEAKSKEIQEVWQRVSQEVGLPLAAACELMEAVLVGKVGKVSPEQQQTLLQAQSSCEQIALQCNQLTQIAQDNVGTNAIEMVFSPLDRPQLSQAKMAPV